MAWYGNCPKTEQDDSIKPSDFVAGLSQATALPDRDPSIRFPSPHPRTGEPD